MTELGTEPPRAIERPYVERVRFAWERKLEAALANVDDEGDGHNEDRWRSPVRPRSFRQR